MKDKIYEFVMLILHWVLYGITIGCLIFEGFQDTGQFVWFVCLSILVIARTFSAVIFLLVVESRKMKDNENNENEAYYRGQYETEVYYTDIQIPKERKEMAEKIYKEYICDVFPLEAKEEFAKQFGVEIKE